MNTVGSIEAGGSYRDASLEDVALALEWPAGATGAYLRGEEAAIPAPAGEAGPSEPPAAVTAARQRILEATPEQLVEIMLLVQEVQGQEAAAVWIERAIRMREAVAELARADADERDAG